MTVLSLKDRNLSEKFNEMRKILCSVDPGNLFRFLVLAVCFVVMLVQVRESWLKLHNPPIITHTRFTLNETISYPALTICREPPYNRRYYELFNFTQVHLGSYPTTSNWKDFPYDTRNISDFWDIAVYNRNVITCYHLNGLEPKEIELRSSLHLTTGMCHTVLPKRAVSTVGKTPGYNILLLHDLYEYVRITDDEPGWYIYIHEVKEKFSENINIHSGRQAWIFVPVGEKVEVGLEMYQFNSIQNCSNQMNYSMSECEENCWIRDEIEPKTNCSGPWLPQLQKPHCNEPNGMIDLVKATLAMNSMKCCQKSCQTMQYKTSIVKRTPYPKKRYLTSGAAIYFSSKAVVTVEEKYSYNWNMFISDLGGSIGFLLGLSVIGIIAYLERFVQFFVPYLKRSKKF